MTQTPQILVPTDFSTIAANALVHAIAYAKKMKASILLLHVKHPVILPTDLPLPVADELIDNYLEQVPHKLETLKKSVEAEGVGCEVVKECGLLIEEVKTYCESRKPILVVTGTHKDNSFFKRVFSSNSIEMALELKSPVLIVPESFPYKRPEKILYATEFNEFDINHLSYLRTWCCVDTSVYVAHVNTDTAEYYEQVEKRTWFEELVEEKTGPDSFYFTTIHNQDVVEGLLNYLDKLQIDMLCLSTERKSFIESIFQRSHTKEIASKIDIPLLIFDNKWKL